VSYAHVLFSAVMYSFLVSGRVFLLHEILLSG